MKSVPIINTLEIYLSIIYIFIAALLNNFPFIFYLNTRTYYKINKM